MRAVLTKVARLDEAIVTFEDGTQIVTWQISSDYIGRWVILYFEDNVLVGVDLVSLNNRQVTFLVHLYGPCGIVKGSNQVTVPLEVLEFFGLKVPTPVLVAV